jgi:RHH-type rel operon transcriptional repressor/antitoxin RelB
MLAIRLPADIESRLTALATATGRTKSFYARKAILDRIDDLEDIYLAEQVLLRIQSGEERIYTAEEVRAHLGLED